LQVSDIRPVKNCFLFELWNAHPAVNNDGSATRPSTEKMWDELLTDGMLIYGVSSDDTHHLKVIDRSKSNPGRGWVMVRTTELTPKAIATALDRGEFYATNGLMLKMIDLTSQTLKIVVDEAATKHEVAKDHVIGELLAPGAAKPGYSVEFFGPAGKLLSSAEGTESTYARDPSLAYFRARVSFVHAINGELRRHRAWTQPVFQDGRVEKTVQAARIPAPAD
jgi:hypothetical protein